MCQAPLGRVVKVNESTITIDANGKLRELNSKLVDVREGDYVLFSVNIAIEKVEPEEAKIMRGEV